ncbi:MAG: hypothetical protein ACRD2W_10950, partial [Acidimicrobiales bacterium]
MAVTGAQTGPVQGQVIGDDNVVTLNFHAAAGVLVTPTPPAAEPPAPHPLPRPAQVLPPPFANLVDRAGELDRAFAALAQGVPVEVCGPPGIGKSAIVRALAHHPRTTRPPDGVVFHSAQGESAPDLVQRLFLAFFKVSSGTTVTEAVARRHLGTVRALVLLDGADLAREDLEQLRNAAPGCTLVTATRETTLFGDGRRLQLGGLGPGDAVTLLEDWTGRTFDAADRDAVHELVAAVDGNPLRLKQAVAAAAGPDEPMAAV